MFVAYRPELGFLYNDAYAKFLEASTRRRSANGFTTSGLKSGTTSIYGQAHDKILAKSAGFSHHFVKPLSIKMLLPIFGSIE